MGVIYIRMLVVVGEIILVLNRIMGVLICNCRRCSSASCPYGQYRDECKYAPADIFMHFRRDMPSSAIEIREFHFIE